MIAFTKMEGLGNDYLYVFGEVPKNVKALSRRLSDRHFGAGADGMIFISRAKDADFSMRIFNADGSEGKMCGNGIRCVGKYVYEKGYTDKKDLTVATRSGVKKLKLRVVKGKVTGVRVDMGTARVFGDKTVPADGKAFLLTPVSVGNPHAVIFCDTPDDETLRRVGSRIEKNAAFPGGVNVEFVRVTGEKSLRMRVWERGSGITLACGTGACAAAAAASFKGFVPFGKPVSVELDGGVLKITVQRDGGIEMSGPAKFVYEGEAQE